MTSFCTDLLKQGLVFLSQLDTLPLSHLSIRQIDLISQEANNDFIASLMLNILDPSRYAVEGRSALVILLSLLVTS